MPSVKYIILTHAHFDHMLEINDWVKKTGATVLVGEKDAPALSDPYLNCFRIFLRMSAGYFGKYKPLQHKDRIMLGDEWLDVIFTPGHTQGAIALYNGKSLFVGDTVFAYGAVGRTDLPGSSHKELCDSIRIIKSFPDNTDIYPGHGESTSVSLIKNLRI